MSTQLKKGVLEMVVLSKINETDRYGYDIYQEVDLNMSISESTIYPILRKFTKDNFCETYLRESPGGPPRKYFRITSLGKHKLEELVEDWQHFEQTVNRMIRGGRYE